ncbi:GNAT family N-acetyltransferase [Paludibacterium yongneupense]|uniref:GNAT family N-acetyltransferase n=1 Tax=Paludibacterium yongneupense TaxID=400061 RepID=UPI00040FC14F|nr:GNAT family N-acetyltransferase [Paludibacterium yongneupense]
MKTRSVQSGEEMRLWKIFHSAVHAIDAAYYNAEQRAAWSPPAVDEQEWVQAIRGLLPLVVEYDGQIVAYADLQSDGTITHFFVHADWQRRGVGTLLMTRLHDGARERGIGLLTAQVSLAAEAFFTAWDFRLRQRQTVSRRGAMLPNAVMEKWLSPAASD